MRVVWVIVLQQVSADLEFAGTEQNRALGVLLYDRRGYFVSVALVVFVRRDSI